MNTTNPALIKETIKEIAKKHCLHNHNTWNYQDRLRAFLTELQRITLSIETT